MDSPAPTDDSTPRLRRRVAELEERVRDLELELAEARGRGAPDGFSWIVAEGARGADAPLDLGGPGAPGLFSVIIPAYNAEAFLAGAVESVWRQTLPPGRIEIVVVDDGSRDGTLGLARGLAERSPVPMRVVTHPDGANRGVSASRNLACARARGEFLALLDADDAFLPERLAAAATFFAAHPESVALCSLGRNVDDAGETVVGHNGTETAGAWRGLDDGLEPPFTFPMLWRVDPVANSSLTVRRSAFAAVGGFPAVMAHQAEDWLLVLELSLLAPLPCLDRKLFLYRHHAAAYTHAYHAGNLRDGARLELFYNLVHWMLRRPDLAAEGRRFFRREYPRVLAAHHRLFPVMRDFLLSRGGAAPTVAGFEDYLAGITAELGSLRRVVQSRLHEARRWRQEALALRRQQGGVDPASQA